MPFKVLAAKAVAKLAPKILPTVAKVVPKILPQVRTIASVVGKASGITGALPGGSSLPQMMATAYDPRSEYELAEEARRRSRGTMYPVGKPPGGVAQGIPRVGGAPVMGARGPISKAPKAPPGGGGGVPTVKGGAGMAAAGMTAAQQARKLATGLFDSFGRWFSDRRVAALARRVGLELAATGLGVAVGIVATSIARDATRGVRRRRRGISYGQLMTTRRTLRKFESMNRYLCKPTAPKRRAACR